MSNREWELYLNDILESIEAIEKFLVDVSYERFIDDRKTYAATIRELEIIGEAVGKLPDELKAKYPDVLWQDIKSFRNKLIHEYFGIDFRIVWDVIKNELPILQSRIINILDHIKSDKE